MESGRSRRPDLKFLRGSHVARKFESRRFTWNTAVTLGIFRNLVVRLALSFLRG